MPLFGGARDISLFRTMNRELINDIIQTEIGYYKFVLSNSSINVYGESENKTYYEPLLISCLINKEDQVWNEREFGPDITQQMTFSFLKADMNEKDLVPEIGDIVLFNKFYLNYIACIYSPYARRVIVDAHLPSLIYSKIKLNDSIIIDRVVFLIESIKTNLTTGRSSLKLLRVTDLETKYVVPSEGQLVVNTEETQWESRDEDWEEIKDAPL